MEYVYMNLKIYMYMYLIYVYNIPLWIQVCTGAPPFYSYKSWEYRSPPQNNLYRMEVHIFFWHHFLYRIVAHERTLGTLKKKNAPL